MAKRSNKTAHILSLIAEQKEDAEETGAANEPVAEEPPVWSTPKPVAPPRKKTTTPSSPRPKKKTPSATTDPIAEEEETPISPAAPAPPPAVAAPQAQPPVQSAPTHHHVRVPIVEDVREADLMLSDQILEALEEELEVELHGDAPQTDTTEAETAAIPDAHTTSVPQAPDLPVFQSAPDMIYTNVMQHLVEDQAGEYIKRFCTCQCSRCAADVKALTLTNLPAKYVVMPEGQNVPMLSYYASQYSILLATQLTRSCVIVNENPRHSPDDIKK